MDSKSLRIVFIGTPDFAVASLKALVKYGYKVVAVVTVPDKPSGRGQKMHQSAVKEYALANNLPILQPEKLKNKAFLQELASFNADLQVVVAFRMLPKEVWDMPPMGTINVHGSLLPQYRGAAPINWAIINGEDKTGVTTFRLKHEIDTGNILLQQEIPILKEDNVGTLYEKMMKAGAKLLLETIDGLANDSITPKDQDTSMHLNHAPKIFKEDGKINWQLSVRDIQNHIRGLSPYPVAYTFLHNKQLKIYTATIQKEEHSIKPGTYDTDGKTYLKFAAMDGWIAAEEVQQEGKKRMKIEDFLRGYKFNN